LQGVRDTANQAAQTAVEIDKLFRADKDSIEKFGRGAPSAQTIYRLAQVSPMFSIRHAASKSGLSFPTASAGVERLASVGILSEASGKRRDRIFVYSKYLQVLNRDL
jgi:Fic family protein